MERWPAPRAPVGWPHNGPVPAPRYRAVRYLNPRTRPAIPLPSREPRRAYCRILNRLRVNRHRRDIRARTAVMGGFTQLRAASHPVDQRVAGDAVPVAEFPELLEVNLIGQDTQRLVSRLLVTQAAQSVNQPLPAIPHGYHPSPVLT